MGVFADGGVGDGDGAARVRDGTGEDSAVLLGNSW
jgi:hypothetical protein